MSNGEQSNGIPAVRKRQRDRAYRHGAKARTLKEAGKAWLEPHFPAEDADLAQAWLSGWQDTEEELSSGESDV